MTTGNAIEAIRIARRYMEEEEPSVQHIDEVDRLFPEKGLAHDRTMQAYLNGGFSQSDYRNLRAKIAADRRKAKKS